MTTTFENQYVNLELKGDVLFVYYKANTVITVEAAKQVVEDRLKLTNNEATFVVAEVSNIKTSTREAREYLSKKDGGLKGIKAGAFISKQVYSYFILNLFLKIIAPSVPAKYFMDKESALNWIEEIRLKEK